MAVNVIVAVVVVEVMAGRSTLHSKYRTLNISHPFLQYQDEHRHDENLRSMYADQIRVSPCERVCVFFCFHSLVVVVVLLYYVTGFCVEGSPYLLSEQCGISLFDSHSVSSAPPHTMSSPHSVISF